MIKINPSISKLKESATLKINIEAKRLRQQGKSLCHFGFGQSPFPVHHKIVQALKDNAFQKDYLPTKGLEELRENICEYYKSKFNYEFCKEHILIAPGSKEIIFQLILTLDAHVLIPAPSWVSYCPQVNITPNKYSIISTKSENNYKLSAKELEESVKDITDKTKLLILNSPNNPTGHAFSEKEVQEIVDVCKKFNILILSDEIYAEVHFDDPPKTNFYHLYPEGTFITAGLSKSHGAGGYRIGFLALAPNHNKLVEALCALISETYSCVSSPIQHAATVAYSNDSEINEYIKLCTHIHKYVSNTIYDRLTALDIKCSTPQGAFYLLINLNKFKDSIFKKYKITSSIELSRILLNEYSVALLPGVDFYLEEENLSFRIATVDYDGEMVLKHINKIESNTNRDFSGLFPNIEFGILQLEKFINELK